MAEEKKEVKVIKKYHGGGAGGAIYGLGIIGVFIYYVQTASSFLAVLIAIAKAIFWPAFLIFKVYGLLGMN